MIQAEKPSVCDPSTRGEGALKEPTAHPFSRQMIEMLKVAMECVEAQWSICVLQLTRTVVLLALALIGLFLATVGALYGLFLLDASFAFALSGHDMPLWISPLVRGLIYLSPLFLAVVYLRQKFNGFDLEPKNDH